MRIFVWECFPCVIKMNTCPQCNEQDTMYNRENDKKCHNCEYIWKPKKVANEYPTRAMDSECGDIISSNFEGVSHACVQKKMCNDNTTCTITPVTFVEIKDGVYRVTCSIHK